MRSGTEYLHDDRAGLHGYVEFHKYKHTHTHTNTFFFKFRIKKQKSGDRFGTIHWYFQHAHFIPIVGVGKRGAY